MAGGAAGFTAGTIGCTAAGLGADDLGVVGFTVAAGGVPVGVDGVGFDSSGFCCVGGVAGTLRAGLAIGVAAGFPAGFGSTGFGAAGLKRSKNSPKGFAWAGLGVFLGVTG
jgi:hypothetical protein